MEHRNSLSMIKASQKVDRDGAVVGAAAIPGDCDRTNDADQLDDVFDTEWRNLLPGICGS